MAGSYDDAPARRMAHDLDGTKVFWDGRSLYNFTLTEETTLGEREDLNTDGNAIWKGTFGGAGETPSYLYFMFPEKREWEGIMVAGTPGEDNRGTYGAAYSTDATSPYAATYTVESTVNFQEYVTAGMDRYRRRIHTVARSNVTCIRVILNQGSGSGPAAQGPVHFYGGPLPTTNPDRLLWIDPDDPAEAEYIRPIDWGELQKGGGPYTNVLKVRNNSSVYTATNIQISTEDLFIGNPNTFFTISLDDVDYGSLKTITSLAPGADTTVYVKVDPASSYTPIGPNAARHYAVVSQWSIA